MPNPFNKEHKHKAEKKSPYPAGAVLDTMEVTNSQLCCDTCYEIVTDGVYIPSSKKLTFECSMGHENVIRNIEL